MKPFSYETSFLHPSKTAALTLDQSQGFTSVGRVWRQANLCFGPTTKLPEKAKREVFLLSNNLHVRLE